VDRLPVLQSFTIKQPGDALKQVQETVIQDVYEKMKALECQLGRMSLPLDIHLHISNTGTVPFKQKEALLEESPKLNSPSEGFK